MRSITMKFLVAAALLCALPARAALNVLACEPEWGALTRELAGDLAKVYEATTALQDVHRIQARPSLIAAARRADLLVCTGAELEIGWLPVLTRDSGNAAIQPGAPGYFEATRYVTLIEVPTRLDRSEGDVHPQGNPHIQTDPRNIGQVAPALAKRLADLDPAHAADYHKRYAQFAARWQEAIDRWTRQAAPLNGLRVVEHHRAFSYLFRWLKVEVTAYLEAKPGIEPSAGHLAEVLKLQQTRPAKFVVRASYVDPRAAEWFGERARIPVVVLPFSIGGDARATDLFTLYDDLVGTLVKAAQ